MTRTRVFCVGFQKTGTSSLGRALGRLGYRVAGYHPFRDLAARPGLDMETVWARARPVAMAHDAVQDTPWPVLYDRLDAAFPGAKFLHVVRDRDAWLKSVLGDFSDHHNEIHRLIYGSDCPVGNEAAWLARYDRHNREVAAHFADRPGDYLRLDLAEIGWDRICPFLGCEIPDLPWPHANTRREKRLRMRYHQMRERLRGLLR